MRGGRSSGGNSSSSGSRSSGMRSSSSRSGSLSGSGSRAGKGLGSPSTSRPPTARPIASRNNPGGVGKSLVRGAAAGAGFAVGKNVVNNALGGNRNRNQFGRGRHNFHGNRNFMRGGGRQGFRGGHRGNNSGCGPTVVMTLVIVCLLVVVTLSAMNFGVGAEGNVQVTRSTVRREALPRNAASDTGPMFTDHLNWIGSNTPLNNGLRNFWQETGVRPHLYIIGPQVIGQHMPSHQQMEAFAQSRYNALFNDEAHLLVVFFENPNGDYTMTHVAGNQARSVMDQEAVDILFDYIQRFYYGNLAEEQFFGQAFTNAGERIMRVERSPWIPVFILLGVIVILIILFIWWKKRTAQKNLESEQTAAILNTPLEEFGSSQEDEASNLAKQYEGLNQEDGTS